MSKCPKCGMKHKKMTRFCSECGTAFEQAVQQSKAKKRNVLLGIAASVIVIIALLMNVTNDNEAAPISEPMKNAPIVPEINVAEAERTEKTAVAEDIAALKEQERVEAKADYIESIEYVIHMHDAAYSAENLKSALAESYAAWDTELNRIYGMLEAALSVDDMEIIRVEQRAWIQERDASTMPEEVGYLTQIELLNNITKARTLYFIELYFDELY